MKLEFNVTDLDECQITLDGKSVAVKAFGVGSGECDCRELPEDSVGRTVLEESWTLALKLIKAASIAEGDLWRKRSDDDLQRVYELF